MSNAPLTSRQFGAAFLLAKRRERGEEITIDDVCDACDNDPIDIDVVALLLFHMMPKPQFSLDRETVRTSTVYVDVRDHEPFVCADHMHTALSFYEEANNVKFKSVSLGGATLVPD